MISIDRFELCEDKNLAHELYVRSQFPDQLVEVDGDRNNNWIAILEDSYGSLPSPVYILTEDEDGLFQYEAFDSVEMAQFYFNTHFRYEG